MEYFLENYFVLKENNSFQLVSSVKCNCLFFDWLCATEGCSGHETKLSDKVQGKEEKHVGKPTDPNQKMKGASQTLNLKLDSHYYSTSFQQGPNSNSVWVQILMALCRKFAMARISDSSPDWK